MSNDLDRLRELAGSAAPKSTKNITGNMYELRDVLNEATKTKKVVAFCKDKKQTFDDRNTAKAWIEKEYGSSYADAKKKGHADIFNESSKPDFADIDGDGDKEEDMKDAAKDKEKTDEAVEIEEGKKPDFLNKDDDEDDKDKTDESYDHLDEMSKFIKMAEWANSPGNQYEDRGHYSEQPEGETVDLSLRRYLDADPHPVKVVEDHTEDGMLKEYKEFKDE